MVAPAGFIRWGCAADCCGGQLWGWEGRILFLLYILAYRRKHVPRLRVALAEHAADVPVVRVGSGREVRRWLALPPDPR